MKEEKKKTKHNKTVAALNAFGDEPQSSKILSLFQRGKEEPCGKPDLDALIRQIGPKYNSFTSGTRNMKQQPVCSSLERVLGVYSWSCIWLRRIFSASRFS